MTYVITQSCCSDASCIPVCPVSCIRPTPGEPDFLTAEMLYIDPGTCIECAACTEACPVGAIEHEDDLPDVFARYTAINAEYFEQHPLAPLEAARAAPGKVAKPEQPWRVAVVGSGPSGMFAVGELLARLPKGAVEVEVFDRLPTPWGLARAGVAPDHHHTKEVSEIFGRIAARPGVRLHLNVEIGQHLTHEELLEHHHAVVYATGALGDRDLGIPGEELAGSIGASEIVAWYNGHPDFAEREPDLSGERAVVVGNGNVALDVARILVADPEELARTDIADHALAALRSSSIREVVVLGRRGIDQAAYTNPELLALGDLPGVEVVVDPADLVDESDSPDVPFTVGLRRQLLAEYAAGSGARDPDDPGKRRIVLRHLTSPTRVLGADRVEGLEVVRNELVPDEAGRIVAKPTEEQTTLAASLVVRSVGFRSTPLPDVDFDHGSARFPHASGRVLDPASGAPRPGVYTTGWAKRGASGVIGTNRICATETVEALLEDLVAGALPAPAADGGALTELLATRQPDVVDRAGWRRIDAQERRTGKEQGRPRVKSVSVADMVETARSV